MSKIALKKDDADPQQAPNTHRLYTMRFCPFSQRVIAMLGHKGVDFEKVNVDLMGKPTWLATKNPNLEVPILQKNGAVIYESRAIMEFIEEVKPEKPTLPKDPIERAHHRMLMDACSKLFMGYFALMNAKGEKEAVGKAVGQMQKALDFYENKLAALKTDFFGGKTVGMVDYTIFPWFERFPIYMVLPVKLDIMPKDKYPLLTKWFERLQTTPGYQKAKVDLDLHVAFVQNIMFKGQFDYNIGADKE